jgi:hypothetical protein
VADTCESGSEPWGSEKGREFLDLLNGYHLLKKDSASFNRSTNSHFLEV